MGTAEDEETGLATYDALVEDARWLIVVAESGGTSLVTRPLRTTALDCVRQALDASGGCTTCTSWSDTDDRTSAAV